MEQAGVAIRIRGQVQGVGFRPTVLRIARQQGLCGEVHNDGEGVIIHLFAPAPEVAALVAALHRELPPLARIDRLEYSPICAEPPSGFVIAASRGGVIDTGVAPDAATCAACREELLDPSNRRYRYPFTNCTHCGPRLTIVAAIPYDRINTSMHPFPLCDDCAREYHDPLDRRFHAQPNACPVCGPRLWLSDSAGRELPTAGDPIAAAAQALEEGKIIALKGIGGFHLACDARSEAVVARLRERKQRNGKAFALMVRDRAMAERCCRVDAAAWALLTTPAAPIVVLERQTGAEIAPAVAPDQQTLGLMLPYSPLHILLLEAFAAPLVLTSGNRSEEPQCIDNATALATLGTVADAFLLHNREILQRVDDSVLRIIDQTPRFYRRARGYAPATLPLPEGFAAAAPILAMGGELKNTFCLLREDRALLSQHIGDLKQRTAFHDYRRTLQHYLRLFRHTPRTIAVDAHPDYRPSRHGRELAATLGATLEPIQHHHAHLAACMADNGLPLTTPPLLGIALDGLGYGSDGTLWGGELLRCDYRTCSRLGHLAPIPLAGGQQAIVEPWRCAYAHLWRCGIAPPSDFAQSPERLAQLAQMLTRGLNSPLTTSAGRLFDAVAALLGVAPPRIRYEGEAAIRLEQLAWQGVSGVASGYPFHWEQTASGVQLDPAPMWPLLLADLARGVPTAQLAARFHLGFAAALVAVSCELARREGVSQVLLSGGVLNNRLLLEQLIQGLRQAGLQPLSHHRVPSNDGGIAYGQAVIAAARGAL